MKNSNLIKALLGFSLLAFASCEDDDMMDIDMHGATLFVTSNASGDINTYEFKDDGGVEMNMFTTLSTGNEGIHYDDASDELIVASRSALQVNVYGDVSGVLMNPSLSLDLGGSGAADLMNPRAMAVNGNTVVIADNQQNQFFVYTRSGNSLML
jgi:6-phosphogluconolactonase (cycloisomerase 2 family)